MLVSYAAIHCALTQHPAEEKGGGGGVTPWSVIWWGSDLFPHLVENFASLSTAVKGTVLKRE